MNVYVEQVLLSNFIIDFCILIMISKLILPKPNYKHISISSIFGSVASLIIPFCPHVLITNTLKLLTSIIMIQLLHINKKQLVLSCMLMLAISYVIGGAILSNLGANTNGGYSIKINSLIPVFAITIIFTFVCCKLIAWVKSRITNNSNIHDITLINNNIKLNIKSFIDSGNSLYDNNKPVSLVNFDTFNKLTNLTLNQYLTNQFNTLTNPHFIYASTIAGKQKILVFTIAELHIKSKIFKNVQLGVTLHFDNSKDYKAILNSYFCII